MIDRIKFSKYATIPIGTKYNRPQHLHQAIDEVIRQLNAHLKCEGVKLDSIEKLDWTYKLSHEDEGGMNLVCRLTYFILND